MKKMKNPRKYVERLKKRVKYLYEMNSELWGRLRKAQGQYWFMWRTPHKVPVHELNASVDNLHPGDEVIMVGKITEIHQTLEGNSAVMEFTEVRVRRPHEG